MERLRGLGHVLLASLLALLACALLSYVGLVILAVRPAWPHPEWSSALTVPAVIVVFGLVIAVPVVVVLAAPAYALLLGAGRASYPAAAAIGVAPGIIALCFTSEIGLPAIATGLVVGVATHWACRVRPNKSFKPNPLRGSA